MKGVENDVSRKLKILFQMGAWIIALFLIIPWTVPGIIISLQYRNDPCVVNKDKTNMELDLWVLIGSSYVLAYMLILMFTICAQTRTCFWRIFYIFTHTLMLGWDIVGIYLLTNANLECKHNSLWSICTAFLTINMTSMLIEFILLWCRGTRGCSCLTTVQEELQITPSPTERGASFSGASTQVYENTYEII